MNSDSIHRSDGQQPEPRPYPLWWDYVNGAVVALAMLATAAVVVTWMVGVTLTILK